MTRFACILLAICFIFCMLPGISLHASADEITVLQHISLDFALPAAGDPLPDTFAVTEGFVIDTVSWQIYRDGQWQDLSDTELVYADDQAYRLQIYLVNAEGYRIDFDSFASGFMPATINSEPTQAIFYRHTDDQGAKQWKGIMLEKILVGAAVPVVRELDISGIPVGSGDSVSSQQIVLSDTHVRIRDCQLSVDWEAVDQFQMDFGFYNIHLELEALEGYVLIPELITINGMPVKDCDWDVAWGFEVDSGWISLSRTFEPDVYVEGVTVSGVPAEITVGELISEPQLHVTWSDHGTVRIDKVQWMDETYGPISGNFENSRVYFLQITLRNDGEIPFRDFFNIEIFDADGAYYTAALATATDAKTAVAYIRYSLYPSVDRCDVTLTDPQIGENLPVPQVEMGAAYNISAYSWKDLTTGAQAIAFEKGHRYSLTVELTPNEDREFDELTVLLNGEAVSLEAANAEYASFTVEYSFQNTIDRIDLFAPELVVGQEVKPEDIVVLTEGVMLRSAYWINTMNFEQLNGVVEKAPYMLRFMVCPEEGMEFTDSIQIYLNGQPVKADTADQNGISCAISYDLRDVIDQIRIESLPQISIGGSTAPIHMTIPEGAPYSVQANWLLYGGDYQFAGPGGAFEEGKLYYLEILIKPADGYRILEDVSVLVGGDVFDGITMIGDLGIWLYKQYNCGLQVIDRVDLTVDIPAIGQVPGAVTLPEGSHISLRDFSWAYADADRFEDAVDLLEGDIFEEGFYYMISGALVADPGYVFAEHVILTVNGVACNIDLGDLGVINLGDTAFLGHSFGLLKESQVDSDPTGDSIGIVIALLLLSGTAAVILKKKQ